MRIRMSRCGFGHCLAVLLVTATSVLAFGALPGVGLHYRNDQFHYGFTIPKGWEFEGDNLLDGINKNNQSDGLPRLDAVVRLLNVTGGLPVWIEIQKAQSLDSEGFEDYVRDMESAVGLSPQKMAEQIDKPELKKLMRASAGLRLVAVDRKAWRIVTESEQPDLGMKNASVTCFGKDVSVHLVYHAGLKTFPDHYAEFNSVVDSLAFDSGHQYNPMAHLASSLVVVGLNILSKLTTPAGLLLVLLLIVAWKTVKRRKAQEGPSETVAIPDRPSDATTLPPPPSSAPFPRTSPPIAVPRAPVLPDSVQAARARVKARLKRFVSEERGDDTWDQISAQDFKDLVTVGHDLFTRGAQDFSEWSRQMAEDFGEGVRKYLVPIWEHVLELPEPEAKGNPVPSELGSSKRGSVPSDVPAAPLRSMAPAPTARTRTLRSQLRRFGSVLLNQTFVVWVAVLMIAGMSLYPPWTGRCDVRFSSSSSHYETRCYAWIWSSPGNGALPPGFLPSRARNINEWHFSIDTSRLMVQCFVVTVLAGAALWSLRKHASRGAR